MKDNITLSQQQLEGIVGSAVKSALGTTSKAEFDGTLASRVDTNRALRASKFNRDLASGKNMVRVQIPIVYRQYIGKTVTVSVNGNTVKIPVDGKFYDVSEAHNHQLQKKLNGVERNIQRNLQQAPNTFGETGDWAPAMI